MKSELYIEVEGTLHRVAEAITWNFITSCDEVIPRGQATKIGNNLQGRKCRKCFGPSEPVTFPESVPSTPRGVVPVK